VSQGLRIEVTDEASSWLKWAREEFPGLTARALKSVGWMMQKRVKEGIRSGAPGGRTYAAFMNRGRRRKLGKTVSRIPFGKLVRAVGYQYRAEERAVYVGWLSASSAALGYKLQAGFTGRVTPKMRRLFFYRGLGMAKNATIDIPARPTIDPMFRELEPEIPKYIENKLWEYLQSGKGYQRSARKYRVHGQ
jgi:hypothetical protein